VCLKQEGWRKPPRAWSEAERPTHAEGLTLHLSERSATGYMGVYTEHRSRFFRAEINRHHGRARILGSSFSTAVEAAVAYARAALRIVSQTKGQARGAAPTDEDAAVSSAAVKAAPSSPSHCPHAAAEGESAMEEDAPAAAWTDSPADSLTAPPIRPPAYVQPFEPTVEPATAMSM